MPPARGTRDSRCKFARDPNVFVSQKVLCRGEEVGTADGYLNDSTFTRLKKNSRDGGEKIVERGIPRDEYFCGTRFACMSLSIL